jgi:hypothetical protein
MFNSAFTGRQRDIVGMIATRNREQAARRVMN